ncbi:MAG: family 10 glycosylhydrolase [candidate division KSB1 bacterium]|nr:family 10 glycosylhydrolase [candidate division KSB1 bacterium]
MKRIFIVIALFLLSQQNLLGGKNQEFRATWVITWEHISAGKPAEQNKALVRKILDNHHQANMNAVLWQCRQSGTAYYNSSFEPWGYYAGYSHPGYDPLAYAVEEGHKRGMEVHAWFNVFQASSTQAGAPAAVHPEWICRDRDGNPMTSYICLSPGLAAVREYTIKVAMEIVRNYDIDGLHLDYVRWNEYSSPMVSSGLKKPGAEESVLDGMITEDQLEALTQSTGSRYLYDIEHPYSSGVPQGFSSWEEWWRWSVTEFVRTLHDSIQAVKPWVRLSAAALGRYNWGPWQGYGDVHQDAALWFNEGYVDQLAPMHYHWTTGQGFYDMLVGAPPQCWGPYIQKGIQEGRLFSVGPGSYIFAEQKIWYRHPEVVEKIRTIPWVDGCQFFSYGSWEDYDYWEEAAATFFNRKTKIRPIKADPMTAPAAPAIAIDKIDSLNYQITVTPPPSIQADQRFALYRSPDDLFDPTEDEILDIHFGKGSYSFNDHFTGQQDYNGIYYYAATTLDRFWNESAVSNAVHTEPIPSLPPTVIASNPAEGDTIPVNSTIVFYFSKTMNQSSFAGAITFNPVAELEQLIWNAANKSLTLDVKGNLAFDTEYTVTIGNLATDVNGRSLDGNGDGIAGDPFSLRFRTRAIDNAGPTIVSSYPDFDRETPDFDVDNVIGVVFDELINPATVLDTTLVLSKDGVTIKTQTMVTAVGDRSVINLKGYEPLLPASDYLLQLRNTITDTTGNLIASSREVLFRTALERYTEIKLIDNFTNTGFWEQPNYSGSTSGIVVANTSFGYSKEVYLPGSATAPVNKRSAFIAYEWMTTPPSGGYLLREYLSNGAPRDVRFDNTYILQCYVYGDGSRNKFRFSLREVDGQGYPLEVSKWVTIDWYGWRLIEWDLSDPNGVGTWLGNEIMDGKSYYVDSFQLTHDDAGTFSGKIYVDNLRAVKKSAEPVGVPDEPSAIVTGFQLFQNYPNPFNPSTTIPFDLPIAGRVVLKVFDLLGRNVATLVDGQLTAGHHEIPFDGRQLASGVYFYRLEVDGTAKHRTMVLVK